jgi:predicted glycosyltransferase
MVDRLNDARLLVYSHDTFGLGHLRRCRTIAHALVEQYKGLSVLILSGSPILGSFDFRARVDYVKIPSVIKLHNGQYTPLGLHLDLKKTLEIRASIIRHTAEVFEPDLFIVDKEPLGLKGEIAETLTMLKERGTSLVLGLRDVMDEPTLLRREWEGPNVLPVLGDLYDEIWVYGLSEIWEPLSDLEVPAAVRRKMIYTGYLPRVASTNPQVAPTVRMDEPYLLVTAGGGGDGDVLMDWVLRAYEYDRELPYAALLVLGPFMPPETQRQFQDRVARQSRVKAITFDSHLEILLAEAAGVVAMGGYNTFCEILSFDKRAVIVPRSKPRREQLIRATRADELHLAKMLSADGARDPRVMAAALRALPGQSLPSEVSMPGLLGGLDIVSRRFENRMSGRALEETPLLQEQV